MSAKKDLTSQGIASSTALKLSGDDIQKQEVSMHWPPQVSIEIEEKHYSTVSPSFL